MASYQQLVDMGRFEEIVPSYTETLTAGNQTVSQGNRRRRISPVAGGGYRLIKIKR